MPDDDSLEKLITLTRTALILADDLQLSNVALRLDQALIALTGDGIIPPASGQFGLDSETF